MVLQGEAIWAVSLMWFMTALVFVFVVLRTYTRIVVVASPGVDDHVYTLAFILLLIFQIFTHLAADHGFGRTMQEIGDMEEVTKATLYECIGQGFCIVGMAVAKWSLGLFMLRLVTVQWHRIAIWFAMIEVGLASTAQVLCFWLSCVPLDFVYDRRIPGGSCPIDTRPTSYILCVSTILCDFFFAIFPWIFIWKLQMSKKDKITIAASLSLGLFAAACGIKRMIEVPGLYTQDYLHDSVGLIVWSSAEMAVTMICIGIPVCRPLYKRVFARFRGEDDSYEKQQEEPSVALQTIGGGVIPGKNGGLPDGGSKNGSCGRHRNASSEKDTILDSDTYVDGGSFTDVKLGVNGPYTCTRIGGGDNTSEEDILGAGYRAGGSAHGDSNTVQIDATGRAPSQYGSSPGQGIMVTESYKITRS